MANKRGRPALDPEDRSVVVSLTLPARAFDLFYRRALEARVTVPEILRRRLRINSDADHKK